MDLRNATKPKQSLEMGNYYSLYCMDCRQYLWLGKETEFPFNRELMYILKDFMLSHTNHNLKVGGDEWNCIYDEKGRNVVDVIGYNPYEERCSKLDYADHEKEVAKLFKHSRKK